MTFDEYNTDENFDKNESSLDELVKLGVNEGKTSDEIKKSLSPKWQKSKKIGEFDTYYNNYSTPKTEQKKEVAETPKTEKTLNKRDKEYLDAQNTIADVQEESELNKLADKKDLDYEQTADTMKRAGQMFRTIDDKVVGNLPTFMFKRYIDGEFGDPKGKDSKIRLAYFMLNGIQSKLKNASNLFMSAAGRSPMFADTTSDYENYQKTNFDNALENRWNKYKQETQHAIDLVKGRDMTKEEAYDTIKAITRNQKLNTAFNMMNEKQKVYLMNVTKEIGDKIGTFSNDELIDFLTGAAVSGDQLTWQEAAAIAVARFGPDAMKKAKEKKGEIDGEDSTAGFGGSGKGGVKLSDGTVIKPGLTMNDKEYQQVLSAADKLSQKYFNGEITAEQFKSDYKQLEDLMKNHPIKGITNNIRSAESVLKENNNKRLGEVVSSFEELNSNAGSISPADYNDQFDNLKANAKKWGASEKELKNIEKKRLSKEQLLKAAEKKNKKK